MEGIVSCIRHSTSNTYTLLSAESGKFEAFEMKSDFSLATGEVVEIKEEGPAPVTTSDPKEKLEKIEKAIDETIEGILVGEPYRTGIEEIDRTTSKMWEDLLSASRLFLRKLMLGAPIIIRFHNDADGAGGAVGLYMGIAKLSWKVKIKPNIVWLMHRGVTYSERDSEWDTLIANGYSSIEKPLLVIIDFGTSTGSNEGIEAIEGRFETIWLDHHPIEEGFVGARLPNYMNPWKFGADSSYTAGLFACVFSHTFADADTKEMENASLVGDYSRFVPKGNAGLEASTILDLITSDPRIISQSSSNVVPSEIDAALNSSEKRGELYNYAKMRLEETLDAALNSVKTIKTEKADIFVLDYGEMRSAESKYPLPGRFSSRLLSRIEELNKRPEVVIVHFNLFISMRVSSGISDVVDIPGVIGKMKELYAEGIDSGGGHKNAASIKLNLDQEKKTVLRSIIETVKENLEQKGK
jgi:RecJ-like exonuclease